MSGKFSKIQKKNVKKWLIKEFNAIEHSNGEFQLNCPFCDNNENHMDYMFNIEKMRGHCWRGFSPRCESGHSIYSLISLMYGFDFNKAKDWIE